MLAEYKLDWYAVATKPKNEERATKALEQRLRLVTFAPWHRVEIRKRGKRFTSQRRLFPGYVFIGMLREHEMWRQVEELDGIHGFVGFGCGPELIPPKEMQKLWIGLRANAFDVRLRTAADRGIVPGAAVRATSGAFAGFCGTIAGAPEDDRVAVFFTLFGRASPIIMGLDAIESVA
ncbi:transcription termination/antitermination protein NusG [Lichenihabitans psoromatis]|uniref:transcription termination/antitermination protein NusG n=1 Tax=Lichenihabitans psoromatis TaxID=2528642 RepID=UPI0010383C7F|nr:transcription termination/antitermination NusG family protein [Lichenihabitans psoromatis]